MQNDFRTVVDVGKFDFSIHADSEMLFLGSCFSDNIGARFKTSRMKALVNPFGVVYNPLSVARLVERALDPEPCTSDELVFHNEKWHHFDFHGSFSGFEPREVCEDINRTVQQTSTVLKSADVLFITFGTSFVYERQDTSEVVTNCHKFPSGFFSRYRLDPEEIVVKYKELIVSLRVFNPKLKIIFTVSPVRHWKDGANGNQVSKAALLLAVDRLVTGFGTEQCAYFPSYEIMMDELRDYRFYTPDMVHISNQSIEHIWQKFGSLMFEVETQQLMKRLSKLSKAVGHRPFNRNAEAYEKFLFYNLKEVEDLLKKFPFLNLSKEKEHFKLELDGYQQRGK